mmetsp:Transcript_4919/g.12988  ORF Transcript_4919/g.12988 Transcript_4919/m.12988 type:complete len:231 (+) Transcript_4919:135-827(+)
MRNWLLRKGRDASPLLQRWPTVIVAVVIAVIVIAVIVVAVIVAGIVLHNFTTWRVVVMDFRDGRASPSRPHHAAHASHLQRPAVASPNGIQDDCAEPPVLEFIDRRSCRARGGCHHVPKDGGMFSSFHGKHCGTHQGVIAQSGGSLSRESHVHPGVDHCLHQQEDIGRTAATEGCTHVHELLIIDKDLRREIECIVRCRTFRCSVWQRGYAERKRERGSELGDRKKRSDP